MAIKLINIDTNQQQKVETLGACWSADANTWVIPDTIGNINPFKKWLPKEEGFIVQRPYFVARSKMPCFRCGKEIPVIALGAKNLKELVYKTENKQVWESWDLPILFCDIDFLDDEIIESLRTNYPFFQRTYCKDLEDTIWGNTCIHCGTLQEEYGEFRYEANPLAPLTIEAAGEIRIVYFKLRFDYFISAGYEMNPLYEEII
jgi:hypothetical protein